MEVMSLEPFIEAMNEAMPKVREAVQKASYAFMGLSEAFYWKARFPVAPKLCIDGREYHRRQKRRTKSKRKR